MRRPLRLARLAQAVTVTWMLVEGVIAVGAGVVAHSVALTAFGFDSFIELFSAAVVLRRVLERSEDEERGSLTGGERTASRLVGWALYLLIAYIVVSAAAGLVLKLRPEASPVGLGLTLTAIVIMAFLWRWRLNLADRLGSPALRGARRARSSACTWRSRRWRDSHSTPGSAGGGPTRSPRWL